MTISDQNVVYWLDLAFIATSVFVFLLTVPRRFVRFSSPLERNLAIRLCSTSSKEARILFSNDPASLGNAGNVSPVESVPSTVATQDGRRGLYMRSSPSFPPPSKRHIGSRILLRLGASFQSLSLYSVTTDKTVGRLLCVFLYIVAVVAACFAHTDPLAKANRLGFVVASQLPIAVALGTKTSIVTLLTSRGYEKLNFLHRCAGIAIFVVANFHFLGHIYSMAISGTLHSSLEKPFIIWGIFALIGVYALFLSSLPFVRRRSYTLFRALHFIGLVMVFVCASFHRHPTRKFIAVAAGLYGADLVLRFTLRMQITKAYLYPIPELGMTRVEIPALSGGWRAGQHVRIRVLSTAMGRGMWWQTHPFSIVSVSCDNELAGSRDGLVLMCKRVGGWTERLYALATSGAARGEENAVCVRVSVDGPYGGLEDVVLTNNTAALLFAGGSGITFALNLAEDMVLKASRFPTNLRLIHLVWVVKQRSNIKALSSQLASLYSRCEESGSPLQFNVSVYCTREFAKAPESDLSQELSDSKFLTVEIGRPKVRTILNSVADDAAVRTRKDGVFVSVCGPLELGAEVREGVRTLEGRPQVGGVHLHEETFGW